MGMYTEVVFKATISKKAIGAEAFYILDYMFNEHSQIELEDLALPKHDFFECGRWMHIGRSSSFYHHPKAVNSWCIPPYDFPIVYIFSRSDIKNYDNEIEKFFEWVTQYDIAPEGDFIGYSLSEVGEKVTAYYMPVQA